MVGDCVSDSGSSDYGVFSNSAALTQSPSEKNSTILGDKTLVKGIGYTMIFNSDRVKIELSSQGTVMRYTSKANKKEYLFFKVENQERIRQIESRSENWKTHTSRNDFGYIIKEQRNAENKFTGYFKIMKRYKQNLLEKRFYNKCEVNKEDWIYYERRKM